MADKMSEETPTQQHRSPQKGETLVDWRLGELEKSYGKIDRKLDLVLDKMNEKESGHLAAIERCGKHGDDIDRLRVDMEGSKRDPVTFWTGIGAAITAVGAAISQALSGRHP